MIWSWLKRSSRPFLMSPEFLKTRRFLQQVWFFDRVPRREFGQLYHCLVRRRYEAGEHLVEEGQVGYALFIIESGCAEVYRQLGDGQLDRLAVLSAGDCFGEMALLHEQPRSATVTAIEPTYAYLLYKTKLEELVDHSPHIAAAILMRLSHHLAIRLEQTLRPKSELYSNTALEESPHVIGLR